MSLIQRPPVDGVVQEDGLGIDATRHALQDARAADHSFRGGAIMGSMCTLPHPVALEAHELFAETNLGDPDHFPGTAQMERDVIEDLRQLLNGPPESDGRFLTGGTEANLFALYVARERTGKRDVVVPEHAHFSFEKAARLLGMNLVWVPSTPDHRADTVAMAQAITPDTALVVGVAGGTELGLVDDIPALAAACVEANVALHVDAAFGGYVLPFIDGPAFAFDVPGVWSVSLDPHKMGQSTIPSGVLMLRDGAHWNHVAVDTPYVSTTQQSQLLGTRPGSAVASTWAVHRALGRAGYRAAMAECFRVRDELVSGLAAAGHALVAPPELNVVTFQAGDARARMQALEKVGVRVNVVPRFNAIRIVVGPHVTSQSVQRLLDALGDA